MTHHVTHLESRFGKLELGLKFIYLFIYLFYFFTVAFFSRFFARWIFKSKTNTPTKMVNASGKNEEN